MNVLINHDHISLLLVLIIVMVKTDQHVDLEPVAEGDSGDLFRSQDRQPYPQSEVHNASQNSSADFRFVLQCRGAAWILREAFKVSNAAGF